MSEHPPEQEEAMQQALDDLRYVSTIANWGPSETRLVRSAERVVALLSEQPARETRTIEDDRDAFARGSRRSDGLTYHNEFARCPACGNATIGLSLPYAINHEAGCKAPSTLAAQDLRG